MAVMPEAPRSDYDSTTALLVVDVQNDFAHPDGNLYVPGGDLAVEAVNREIETAASGGAMIVYTQDWHPPSTPHFEKDGGIWPTHCVRDTWGAEFHPELRIVNGPVVRKGTGGEDGYSAFSVRDPESGEVTGTGLSEMLREHGIERVVVVGLARDVCVKETVLDAIRLGFQASVVVDATRPVDLEPGDGERALAAMAEAGADLQ